MSKDLQNLGVDVDALSTRLLFKPKDGCIWLEGERMVLVHQTALAELRIELMEALGPTATRQVLTRFGHASGATDAAIARKAKPDADAHETFKAGPRLHAIEGIAASEPVAFTLDPETGYHAGEWIWRNSVEASAHLDSLGRSAEPVCWMAIGYASAYTSAFMGRPIVYKEVECRAMGASQCRIIGKPQEEWDDVEVDELYKDLDLTNFERPDESEWHTNIALRGGTETRKERLIGTSSGFRATMKMVERVATTHAPRSVDR